MELLQFNSLSLILVLTGFIFYVAGFVQYKYPPKRINHLYGYRTKKSMSNLKIWKFAQSYAAKKMQGLGFSLFFLGLILSVIDINKGLGIWLGIALVTAAPFLMLFEIEKELKKRFPKGDE
ncbi:SdpI family protein [Flavobacteriaceae bacterium]|nr:SdpI family protein [Flavobacteriaceae bacterium]